MEQSRLFNNSSELQSRLRKALEFREGLKLNTNAMRLVNGMGDDLPNLIIDRYHQHFVIYAFDPRWIQQKNLIKDLLSERFSVDYLVIKDRSQTAAPSLQKEAIEVLVEGHSQTIVEENSLRFIVDLNDHLNQGLFLDMRKNRKLVASLAKDKEVLNCFAYTCSFGAYCRQAGAQRVVNVDISAKFLTRGQENYKINRLKTGRSEFLREHAIRYIERASKRNNLFDIIVLDPPSFSRFEGKNFSVKRDLPEVLVKTMRALKPEGVLFVSTNLSSISRGQLETWVKQAARLTGSYIMEMDKLGQDVDFRGSGLMKESFLSALLVKLRRKID